MERKSHCCCPTCGRPSVDWAADRGEGAKGRQHHTREDRTLDYRAWHRTWASSCFVSDIDQLEWRMIGGEVTPVALIELTRIDGAPNPPASYFRAILTRFEERDAQAKAARTFARLLGVTAWIVVYHHDLSNLWVYNLSNSRGWFSMSPTGYQRWLENLGSSRERWRV
jgi:hypothetical protein